jgi:hypothetical protein
MLQRSVRRLSGGGHGPLFPITKSGNLAPTWVMERKQESAPPKGMRFESSTEPPFEGKWQLFSVPVHKKKAVKIPESAACTVASVTSHLGHKKHPLSSIAQANIQDKQRSEDAARNRNFLAHKVKAPEAVKRTGDVVECNDFFERWVLDHRCILNDNPMGVKPVKMPWQATEEYENRHGLKPKVN